MGIFDYFKEQMPSSKRKRHTEELDTYLVSAKENLKMAGEFIFNFLNSVKEFQPAQRHQDIYNREVIHRLSEMRKGIRNGVTFIEEKRRDTINTMNSIRSAEQLRGMVHEWIGVIKSEDENVFTITKLLEGEMWNEDKAKRMFPIPKNKVLLSGYLATTVSYLTRSRDALDQYVMMRDSPVQPPKQE